MNLAPATHPRLPRMLRVRQDFPPTPRLNIPAVVRAEFNRLRPHLKPGASVALGVGSRGITNLALIVREVLDCLRQAGAKPFIFPAMGSHGGATPDGQQAVLADYGITEAAMGVPIKNSMETRQVGATANNMPVYCSVDVLKADGVILVNRIKPHTDFYGAVGSGLLKMAVVGLGKRDGAAAMHAAASYLGHEAMIREMAHALIEKTPILGGIAILENQLHDTARILAVPRDEMEKLEDKLLAESRALMPSLPFEEIDLLIVDQMGKNISGVGMDPNITGRWVNGYSASLMRENRPAPFIRRIFVRELTAETHGNALGIGMADIATTRLIRAIDLRATYINSLTALTPQTAKIPIHFETDREALEMALTSLAISDVTAARVVRIRDTLSLSEMDVSESLLPEVKQSKHLQILREPCDFKFDAGGNLK